RAEKRTSHFSSTRVEHLQPWINGQATAPCLDDLARGVFSTQPRPGTVRWPEPWHLRRIGSGLPGWTAHPPASECPFRPAETCLQDCEPCGAEIRYPEPYMRIRRRCAASLMKR